MLTINERMKWVLEQENLNLKQASERSGIPYRSLQNYISGSQAPGADALAKFHSTFKSDLNWLVSGEGEYPYSQQNMLANQEIDPKLSEQIVFYMRMSMPQYFKSGEAGSALKAFQVVYNQVCHMMDSDERAVSIRKANGLYLVSLHDEMSKRSSNELKEPGLSHRDVDENKLIIESAERGKAKTIERYGLHHDTGGLNVNQKISGSNHLIAGRDLVKNDKS